MAEKTIEVDENGNVVITTTPDPVVEVTTLAVMAYRKSDLAERKARLQAEIVTVDAAIAEIEAQELTAKGLGATAVAVEP